MNMPPSREVNWPQRTANSAVAEPPAELVLDCAATANALPAALTDGWHVLVPFGEFPAPDASYVQVFGAEQAGAMLRSWNSLAGRSFRWMKNVRHRLKPSLSMPIFDAPPGAEHPDLDPFDWSKLPIVGEITELRASNSALQGFVKWSEDARRGQREAGPLYPSINWWHERADAAGRVYPEHVESVTLTRTPNIRTVPAWTANTLPALAGENQNHNATMNEQQMKELRVALGLPESADAAAILTAARTANAATTQLQTANTAKADVEIQLSTVRGELATANTKLGTITAERDQLRTANAALTTEVEELREGVLNIAEKRGGITPAQRADVKTKLATANSRATTLAELQTSKALNTQPVEINGTRHDLSTANSRQAALTRAVKQRMKADGCDYDTAYQRVKADPACAPIFAAMNPAK